MSRILARVCSVSVTIPAWLPVKQSDGHPEVVQGHGQQGHGLALAGGDQHVHLPARAGGRDLGGQVEQLVGLLAHGADDDDHLVAAPAGPGHVVGHGAYAIGVGDRGAPELLHEQLTHDRRGYQRAPRVPAGIQAAYRWRPPLTG